MRHTSKLIASLLLAVPGLLLGPAQAQTDDYPNRAITMIVPFPAGGPTDIVARLMAKQMGDQMGQSIVVENRGGASGTIGMQAAVNAKPDGYTILYNTSSIALSTILYKNLS
ncbi:MAG: tripartite tricarboxylate transporter substrate-binding protein, partial [Burkholderiaceae bacterium]